MLLQYRRGMQRTHAPLNTVFNCLRLSLIGDDTQNMSRFENLLNRHRNGLRRNFVETIEPTLSQLLPPARFIECYHEIRLFSFEISRWVVESQMAIFADADKRDIDRVS